VGGGPLGGVSAKSESTGQIEEEEEEEEEEERFLTAQADPFAGAKGEEKASACSVRNDGVGGRMS